jgi:hypothetical protein
MNWDPMRTSSLIMGCQRKIEKKTSVREKYEGMKKQTEEI